MLNIIKYDDMVSVMSLFILLAFLLSALSMPIIIKVCKHLSLYDYVNARKIHSGNIPRIGGIGIAIAFFLFSALYLRNNHQVSLMLNMPVLCAGLIIFVFAFLDDVHNFHASVKLAAQLTACGIIMFNDFRFTQILGWHLPLWFSHLITFCWILGLINAYNLIDGMDGLCGTLSFTAGIVIGVINILSNNPIAGVCFIFSASIAGFLLFNRPPAKIFMGDCGSQFLGFIIAILPLYPTRPDIEYNKFFIMIAITALPVFDTIAAIWRRIRDKKPLMSGDCCHLHHKLIAMQKSKVKALFFIDFVQLCVCTGVIGSTFLERNKGLILLLAIIALEIIFFSVIHFSYYRVVSEKE